MANVSSNDCRILIKSAMLRKKLRGGVLIDDSLLDWVSSEEPWLENILRPFLDCETSKIPKVWKDLLHDLTASTAAIGLTDPGAEPNVVLRRVLQEEITTELLELLSAAVPALYAVIRADLLAVSVLKPAIQHLLVAIEYVQGFTAQDLAAVPCSTTSVSDPETLPKLPVLVTRGSYTMDKQRHKICTKKSMRHRTLTPGIFTVTCIHGRLILSQENFRHHHNFTVSFS